MSTPLLPETHRHPQSASMRRGGRRDASPSRPWKFGLLAVGGLVALVSAAALIRGAISLPATGPRLTHTITRGDLAVTVTEQGTLESSQNTEIKCEVRGGYGGRGGDSTVTWVIPSGTVVQPGDELVRLDTKIIEETVSLGKTDTNIAKAALARAKADLAKAQIAIDAYEEGRYRSQLKSLEKQLGIAKWNLATAQKMLRNSQSLFEQGYLTELELEGSRYTVKQAELELSVKETEIDVLSRLTKAMELETLNGQLTAARARLEGRKAGLELEQGRLRLAMEELENCVIKAEQGGLVIYPSTAKWKDTPDITEGASVHNNQVLLLMPDLSQMQVKVEIHESIISRVKPGLPARVTLPNRTLETAVSLVASVANPAGWWDGNAVEYDTIIRLPSVQGLKPGMSAEVELTVAQYQDVPTVPVAAVVQTDQGDFCWVETSAGPQRRRLQLGDGNDLTLVVEAGLEEGERVVLHPLDSVAEARGLIRPMLVHNVERGDLLVSLTERGILESAQNTEIKCNVRGASTINWVIDSGTVVQAGDEVVKLENKQIEDFLHERTKFAHLSRDAAIGFRAQATRAGLAITEYLEGRFRTELMTLQKDLAIAEESLRTAQSMLDHARLMFGRGYESELDVEQREFAVEEAELAVAIKHTQIDVLKRFAKEEELKTLQGNWEAAKAAAEGHEEVLRMDEARMALAQEEIERCVVKAERSGLVIYPTSQEWKHAPDIAEGATVHHDQVLLLMPDLSKMQVRVGIHETMIDQIRPGMTATVTLPDRTLAGQVSSVASAARPAGWWTGNMVKYDAMIQLPSVEGLKPGMSADVEIAMARHQNVLMIPLAAVVESAQGTCCWVGPAEQAQRRTVQLGDSNDVFAVVEKGLKEGEQVVLDPHGFVQDPRFRSSPAPDRGE